MAFEIEIRRAGRVVGRENEVKVTASARTAVRARRCLCVPSARLSRHSVPVSFTAVARLLQLPLTTQTRWLQNSPRCGGGNPEEGFQLRTCSLSAHGHLLDGCALHVSTCVMIDEPALQDASRPEVSEYGAVSIMLAGLQP